MSALIQGEVFRMQFAANGEWETSLISPTASELKAWLRAAPPDIALEIFFNRLGDRDRFIGIRLAGMPSKERERVCDDCVDFFRKAGRPAAHSFLTLFRTLLKAPALFPGTPAFLELGVVNAWQSAGPSRFWPDTSAQTAVAAFRQLLASQPRYSAAFSHPVAIEIAFAGPPPHRIGLVISDEDERGHWINPDAALQLLGAIDLEARR
jgi:hypothetical protein